MKVIDAITLAKTKERSHRIRNNLLTFVSGLLFAVIIATISISQASFDSIAKYDNVKLNGRAVVSIQNYSPGIDINSYINDKKFISQVEIQYNKDLERLKSIAKKHQVDFDQNTILPSPIEINSKTKEKSISETGLNSPSVIAVATRKHNETDKNNKFDVDKFIKSAGISDGYQKRGTIEQITPKNGSFEIMRNGKEKLRSTNPVNELELNPNDSLQYISLSYFDQSLSKPFISNNHYLPSSGEIPVILPFDAAEQLLKLKPLKNNASNDTKRERIQYVNDNVAKITIPFCYRNEASQSLLGEAVAQSDEIKKNKDDKNYQQPNLLYNLPTETSCGATTVKSDKRTEEEKKLAANLEAFETEAGLNTGTPFQQKIALRGIGISSGPYSVEDGALSIDQMISSIINVPVGYGAWLIPENLFSQVPEKYRPADLFSNNQKTNEAPLDVMQGVDSSLFEFSNIPDARKIINSSTDYTYAAPFGSSILLMDQIKQALVRVLFWAIIGVSILAILILWILVGRTISESRKESAVFRAIGAKRRDIATIYGTYTILLALRIVFYSILVGLLAAGLVQYLFTDTATLAVQVAYATIDNSRHFNLISFPVHYFGLIAGIIVVASLIASIIPIALGARRNPIKDMRDDG